MTDTPEAVSARSVEPVDTLTPTLRQAESEAGQQSEDRPATAQPAPAETGFAPSSTHSVAGVAAGLAAGVLVLAAWWVLALWGLNKAPLHTTGEPREALVVWEMTHGGGWILPRRNGVELPSKPPLFHWLGALTSMVRGATDEWSIRFPSAAFSLLGAWAVLAAGTQIWNVRAGLFAALALLTAFEWARAGTNARVDMTHTFGLELALLSLLFWHRTRTGLWLVLLYLGISLAILGKGPVGLVVPALVAVVMCAVHRDFSSLRQVRMLAGTFAVLGIAGTWYAAALFLGGWEFFHKHLMLENVLTMLGPTDLDYVGHRHSPLYLVGVLLLGFLPWTLFFPAVVARLWRERSQLRPTDARTYLLVWIAVIFVFYCFSASKRSVYLLPVYPALTLLLGWWWDVQSRDPRAERWLLRPLRVVAWIGVGVLLLLGAVTLLEWLGVPLASVLKPWLKERAQPYTLAVSDLLRRSGGAMLACTLIAATSLYVCIRATRQPRWAAVFASACVSIAAVIVAARQVVLPVLAEREGMRDLMAHVRAVVGTEDNVWFYKTFSYGAVYYWGEHIPFYTSTWPEGAPRFLLMPLSEWQGASASVREYYALVPLPMEKNLGEASRMVLVRRTRLE